MTTKFRSACDRCHYTKVRCSGETPCQGCVNSQSLCFYSVSNPLGRPRGTKNKASHNRSNRNNSGSVQGIAEDDTAAGEQRGSNKPAGWRRRGTKGNRNEAINDQNTAIAESERSDTLALSSPWNQSPAEHMLFFQGREGKDDFDFNLPDLMTPNGHTMSNSPTDSGIHIHSVTPPSRDSQFGPLLAGSVPNLPGLDDPIAQSTFLWNSMSYNIDKQLSDFPAGADTANVSSQNTSKPASGTSTPVVYMGDTSQKSSLGTTCTCFQLHAELLSNSSILELNACNGLDDKVLSLDKAVSLAKQGAKVWRSLTACPKCPYSNEQEVIVLSMMSIRLVTRYLQQLAPRYGAGQCAASRNANVTNNPQSSKPEESSRLTIGSLELDGDEKMAVYRVVFRKTVQMLRQTVDALQMIQHQRKKRLLMETLDDAAGEHNQQALEYIQQVLHSLAVALQVIESSLTQDEK